MQKIRKGDVVEVISGDDCRMRGAVLQVDPKKDRVVVQGVNVVKKHQRPIQAGRGQVRAGIIEFEAPIHVSNVMLVCPSCEECSRVGFLRRPDGALVRICKRCEAQVS